MPHEIYREFLDRKLSSIDNHIMELIGGITVTKILENGVISDTTAYQTATFSDVSDYGAILVVFKIDGTVVPEILYFKTSSLSTTPLTYDTYVHRHITGQITNTTISTTDYSGSYRNITVDIYAIDNDITGG